MFIGHYGPALALKAVVPKAPIAGLLVACQIIDYAWAGLILAGVEHAAVEPGHLEGSHLALSYMPFSHSLLGAALISAAFAAIVTLLLAQRSMAIFWALFAAGVSHWFMDLIVHAPDLTLTGSPPYFGFGLWAHKWESLALEAALVAAGLWLMVRATRYTGPWGAWTPWALGLLLAALGAVNALMAPPASIMEVATSALLAFTLIGLAGWAVDKTRAPRP
jgi:hypothetical protein